jgi:hypothetical protein
MSKLSRVLLISTLLATPITAVAQADLITLENCLQSSGEFEPLITCEVHNGLGEAIAALGGRVSYVEPDRTVPWGTLKRGIDIPGGIEPNETRKISFPAPTIATDLPIGRDAHYRVEIDEATNVEGDHIFYGSGLTVGTTAPLAVEMERADSELPATDVDAQRDAVVVVKVGRGVGDLVAKAD